MTLRCERCGDVIGVYEPMIVLRDGQPHTTSKAAEQKAPGGLLGQCCHAACYEQLAAKRALERT